MAHNNRRVPRRSKLPGLHYLLCNPFGLRRLGAVSSGGLIFGTTLAERRKERPFGAFDTTRTNRYFKENTMSSHWVFNGIDDTVKAGLEAYWTKKL